MLFMNDFSLITFIKSFTPIRTNSYWFVTKYIALIFLSPFINRMVQNITKKEYNILLIILCFLQLDIYHFPYADRYENSYGTSLLFFILLFLTGGYIGKYKVLSKVSIYKKWCVTIVLGLFIAIELFLFSIGDSKLYLRCQAYHGLLFFLAIMFLICIRDTKIHSNRITNHIVKFAPYTFGVYLIHAHSFSDVVLWNYILPENTICNTRYYIPIMVGFTLMLFLVCVFIDYLRSKSVVLIKKQISKFEILNMQN